jgi:hypothetical protein
VHGRSERADIARLYADWCRADNSTPADVPRTAAWDWFASAVDVRTHGDLIVERLDSMLAT